MPEFVIVLTPDESGGFVVTVPDLPGCVTHGYTLDAALANAREAIALYLDGETAESLTAACPLGGHRHHPGAAGSRLISATIN